MVGSSLSFPPVFSPRLLKSNLAASMADLSGGVGPGGFAPVVVSLRCSSPDLDVGRIPEVRALDVFMTG